MGLSSETVGLAKNEKAKFIIFWMKDKNNELRWEWFINLNMKSSRLIRPPFRCPKDDLLIQVSPCLCLQNRDDESLTRTSGVTCTPKFPIRTLYFLYISICSVIGSFSSISTKGSRSHDCMVVGFTTTYGISAYHYWSWEFESRSWRGVLNTKLCHKVCQWLATSGWFSLETLVSSSNKNNCPI
jgi:hypothetical protein